MAMVHCRECGKDVSTEAKTCPHCGVKNPGIKPFEPPKITPEMKKALWAAFGILLLVLFIIDLLDDGDRKKIEADYLDKGVLGIDFKCDLVEYKSYAFVGCYRGSSPTGNIHLWMIERDLEPRFLAVNGTARTAYTRYFLKNQNYAALGLPIPSDIDIGEILDQL